MGFQSPHKNTPFLFHQALPPLNLQTVLPPFLANPPIYWFFCDLPPKNQIFQWTPIIKFFILNPIPYFKSN